MEKALANVLPRRQFNKHSDEVDLRNLIAPLITEKWVVITITLLVFMLSLAYAVIKAPVYQANVLLEVQSNQDALDRLSNNLLPIKPDDVEAINKQIALIRSRYIIEPVILQLGLNIHVLPHYFPIIGGWYARHHAHALTKSLFGLSSYAWGGENIHIANLQVPPDAEEKKLILRATGKNTYSLFDPKNHLILSGTIGQLAKNNDPYHPFSILVDSLQANQGTQFTVIKEPIEKLVTKLSQKLVITELGAPGDVEQKTGVLQVSTADTNPAHAVALLSAISSVAVQRDTEYKSLESEKTLTFLNQQLPIIKKSLNNAEYKLNRYMAKKGSLDLATETRLLLTQISNDEGQLAQLNILRSEKLQQFTPLHPFILQLNDRINAVQSQIAWLKSRASKLPSSDQIATNLQRDVEVKSQLYLLLLNKIQSLQVTKAGTLSDVRILSSAELPDAPQPLPVSVILAGGFLLGLMLGSLVVYTRKMLRQNVDSPLWIEQHYGIPNFAIIPYSALQYDNVKANKNGHLKSLELLAKNNPHELSIEALRSLRTSLHFALQDAPSNIISIMGITPNVGKSFISTNIAYILADTGKRVLLIDGDMRRGSIYKYFNCKNNVGLSDVVNGAVDWTEAVKKTNLPTLDFIATGKYPNNPSELLMRPLFKQFLDHAKAQYDVVIIDTVPVLYVTDGMIIGSVTGLNLLVLDNAAHSEQEIELAFRHMHNSGVKIAGTIFNHTTRKAAQYGQGHYYYNYSYALPK